jgi:hypothetical protein
MREFVNFIFHNDLTLFLLCFLLTITPMYGIMLIHSNSKNK